MFKIIETIVAVIGAVTGSVSLIWQYKEAKKKTPNVSGYIDHASYEFVKVESNHNIILQASFVIHNRGSSPTSLVDSILALRLSPDLGRYLTRNALKGTLQQSELPYDIKANGTTKIDLTYSANVDDPDLLNLLDRCLSPIDIRNPKQPEVADLPLAVNFFFKHTFGEFEMKGCVFRKDQSESQLRSGNRDTYLFREYELDKEKPQLILIE